MKKRISLWIFKLFGIALFLWILAHINREQLGTYIRESDYTLLAAALVVPFLIYLAKAARWKLLVRMAGIEMTFEDAWRMYNIGIFLGTITPGKMGEFGKAAYLQKGGVPLPMSLALVLLDRLMDVLMIGAIAIFAMWTLFGALWGALTIGAFVFLLILLKLFFKKIPRMSWKEFAVKMVTSDVAIKLLNYTLISWMLHFVWAILIARSVGITIEIPILVSAFTLTGIISMLPIAPSGLGTRDAALLTLLAAYGIQAEQAVYVAFLMFVQIIVSGFLGGWYWISGFRR